MRSDEDILLRVVIDNPDDDTARLVYADAVQERDEALAELIRVGVRCHCTKLVVPLRECLTCGGRQWARRCEHEGCREVGFGCYMPGYENDTTLADGFYCGPHAPEHGFCARCGGFFAGIESFDFAPSGMCSDCQSDAEEENDEHYRDDEYYDGEDGYADEF